MQYLVLIYRDESKDADVDWADMDEKYGKYTAAIAEAGVLLSGERLAPATATTTVTVREGQRLLTDGPFAEVREQLGGFYMLECTDLDQALEWAGKCPGAEHGIVEVRPVVPSAM